MDRRCPGDTSRTVREVFTEEQSKLMLLPDNPFAAEEKLAVSVGKTPFVRFDLNDYSVPADYVRTNLVVVADEQQVRVLAGHKMVACHPRHYGKAEHIVQDEHIAALLQHKRQAKTHNGQHRLLAACPQTEQLLQQAIERGHPLATTVRLLLQALDDYGSQAFSQAVVKALTSDSPHASAVAQILQCEREKQHRPPPLAINVSHPKAKIQVQTASLDRYNSLITADDDSGEEL
jgi:hypothetical protein